MEKRKMARHLGMVNGIWHTSIQNQVPAESGWTNYPPLDDFMDDYTKELFTGSRVSLYTEHFGPGSVALIHFNASEDSVEVPLWLVGMIAMLLWLPVEMLFMLAIKKGENKGAESPMP